MESKEHGNSIMEENKMINKKIGFIGCGNMGGAILFGALESGVLPKENAYVYDISPAMMEKAFEIAGYPEEEVEKRFGALYKAFQYGTPPHAGAAPGLDRMVMLIADEPNIREVIAFPKNKKARDVLMNAPSNVAKEQLNDVHLKIDIKEK